MRDVGRSKDYYAGSVYRGGNVRDATVVADK